ncbi:MAG: hypothetical protein U5O69_03560 [Candidatus Competibacteraceae bacterium]|nr:hypothetical protein [Candidatus Competibacteraceae bacterium]
MKANPGGIVSPSDVIGRDRLITQLWAILEQQGLVLVAERRMGKTAIIRKMEAEPAEGWRAIYMDVEGVSRAAEFIERLALAIRTHLSASNKATQWFRDFWSAAGGFEVASILKLPEAKQPHWKTVLERLIGELARNADQRIVLVWDEFPWMLQKIARAEGAAVVVDLLDVLRGLRQTHANPRLVFTGSIGLHHVVAGLQDQDYVHSPLNDLRTIEIPPLAPPDAVRLADALLRGERLAAAVGAAERIAAQVEGVPYYIHHVVATLADLGQPVTVRTVDAVVARSLTEPQDAWNLEHYRNRLGAYYGESASLARTLLDVLAETEDLDLDALHEQLRIKARPDNDRVRRIVEGDREGLRELIKLMQRDHYLEQDERGAYRFRFALIRRWWRIDLGLG